MRTILYIFVLVQMTLAASAVGKKMVLITSVLIVFVTFRFVVTLVYVLAWLSSVIAFSRGLGPFGHPEATLQTFGEFRELFWDLGEASGTFGHIRGTFGVIWVPSGKLGGP